MQNPMSLEMSSKILVVKPSALGDVVHSLPFLNALKTRYPKAEIHWVVARGIHEILQDHPMIDRLWVIDKNRWKRPGNMAETCREICRLAGKLRREDFDVTVDLQGLLRSGIITFLAGSRHRIGFKEAREGSRVFYTHTVQGGRDIHAVERYLRMAATLDCDVSEVRHPFPPLPDPQTLVPAMPEDYFVIAPAAGSPVKRWAPERFGELALRLSMTAFIVAGEVDSECAERVATASGDRAISLAGRLSLKGLAALIAGARFVVCNDTGPMHIAAAVGVPVFAVFGPTSAAKTGPYGDIHTVVRSDLECSPCYRRKLCKDWRCMDAVTVDRVLALIQDSGWN